MYVTIRFYLFAINADNARQDSTICKPISRPTTDEDIPKYDSAGVFPSDASEHWDQLLEVFETKYGSLPDLPISWIGDTLKSLDERRVSARPQPQISDKVVKKAKAASEHQQVIYSLSRDQ